MWGWRAAFGFPCAVISMVGFGFGLDFAWNLAKFSITPFLLLTLESKSGSAVIDNSGTPENVGLKSVARSLAHFIYDGAEARIRVEEVVGGILLYPPHVSSPLAIAFFKKSQRLLPFS